MENKFGFVILHYNTIEETRNCVQSLRDNLDTSSYEIVIVDNGSPDHSGEQLVREYEGKEDVHVLLNGKNLGFAGGNNIGYAYARDQLGCSFISVLNNDTVLLSKDYCRSITEEYGRSGFAVCGPRIILRDGSDNYIYPKMPDSRFLEQELRSYRRTLYLMRFHLDHVETACKMIRNRMYRRQGKEIPGSYKAYYSFDGTAERHEDILLHGCWLVFSPVYIRRFGTAFDPRTFLYREEEILWIRCRKNGFKTVYTPAVRIMHLEDAATNSIKRDRREKIRFRLENLADSLEIEIRECRELEEQ